MAVEVDTCESFLTQTHLCNILHSDQPVARFQVDIGHIINGPQI